MDGRYKLRNRIFLALLLAILPAIFLSVVVVELFIAPHAENEICEELTRSTSLLANAIQCCASVAIRDHLKSIAERNRDYANFLFSRVKQGTLSREEAREQLRAHLLSQKIGKSGYIFCLDRKMTLAVHPKPELQGKLVSDENIARMQLLKGDNYMEYEWQNPGETAPRAKALYQVYFEPLDWFISVSSYRAEFSGLLNPEDFRPAVEALRFGKNGYAYIFTTTGEVILHPYLDTVNVFEQEDIDSGFVRKMINNQVGVIEYEWLDRLDNKWRAKIGAYQRLRDFDWIVASAAYRDEVFAPVRTLRFFIYGCCSFLVLIAGSVAYVLSRRITRPLESMVRQLDVNRVQNLIQPLLVEDRYEIGRLAADFNSYLHTLRLRDEALRQERQRYQELFHTAPDAILTLRDLNIVDCNPAALGMFGLSRDQLLGHSLIEFSPPAQTDGSISETRAKDVVACAQAGVVYAGEWLFSKPDHELIYTEMRLKPFGRELGDNLFVAFISDITASRRAAEALRQSQQRIRDIADNSPGIFYQFTVLGSGAADVTYLSDRFHEIAGLDCPPEKFFENLDTCLVASDRIVLKESLERAFRHRSRWQFEGRFQRPGGGLIWLSALASPQERGGELIYNGVLMNITERKKLEEQVSHVQKMDAIGQLAGGIAHDFNNMLGGIMGAAEIIQIVAGDEAKVRQSAQLIVDTATRAAQMTSKLLTFARKGKLENTQIDLAQVLLETIALLQHTLDKRIVVTFDQQIESAVVNGDFSVLQNVFLNMGINSGHAMPEGGTLSYTLSQIELEEEYCAASRFMIAPGPYMQVEVRDTGCGMSFDELQHIFEPFFTTREKGEGTGLGLAAVYGAVQQHHGAVTVYSEPGVGAVFRVMLPAAHDKLSAVKGEMPPELVHGTGRILVVEDEEMIRATAQILLESLGYEVTLADDGVKGITIYERDWQNIDLVLLDMIMPEMNGRECFLRIRQINPKARVILASGFSQERDIAALQRQGLAGFISKPYRQWALSQMIAQVLKD